MKFKTITKASDLQVNHIYRNDGNPFNHIKNGDVFRVTRLDVDGDPWFSLSSNFNRELTWFSRKLDINVEHLGEWAVDKSLNKGDKVVVLKDDLNAANVHIGDVLTTMGTPAGKYLANDLNYRGEPWEWWLDSDGLALLATDAEEEGTTDDKPVIYPALVNGCWAILNRETGEGWKSSYQAGRGRTMEYHLTEAKCHLDCWLAGDHNSLDINYTFKPDDLVVELSTVEIKSPENARLTHVKYSDGNDLNITRSSQGGVVVDMNSGDSVSIQQDKILDFASDILRVAGLDPTKVSFNDKGQHKEHHLSN